MGVKKFSESEIKAVICLYKNNFSYRDIQKVLDISRQTISSILKKNNVKIRPMYGNKRITDEEMHYIRRRINNGDTQRRIAEDLGLDESTISKRLKNIPNDRNI